MLFSAQNDRTVNYSICGTKNMSLSKKPYISLTRKVEDVVFYRSWDGLIKFINVFIKNYKLCIKEE